MDLSRRHMVQLCGSVFTLGLAGCLQGNQSNNDQSPTPADDEQSPSGRLVNETSGDQEFQVTILDGDDLLFADDITVGPQSTEEFSGTLGTLGNEYTIDVAVGRVGAIEDLRYEVPDGDGTGVLEITFTADQELTIAFVAA